jgi:phosphoserine phosphatase
VRAPHDLRLFVTDMDSTLIEQEVIDELAREAGRYDAVADVTRRAMEGDLDFTTSLRERVAQLAGVPVHAFDTVRRRLTPRAGVDRLVAALKGWGVTSAIVSGGFIEVVEPLRRELGFDRAEANRLEVVDGHLTGRLLGPIVDRARKAAFLRELGAELDIPPRQTMAVGDGANDLDLLHAAAFGVAFNAKPEVRRQARYSVEASRFDAVLTVLGVTDADIDAAAGINRNAAR